MIIGFSWVLQANSERVLPALTGYRNKDLLNDCQMCCHCTTKALLKFFVKVALYYVENFNIYMPL